MVFGRPKWTTGLRLGLLPGLVEQKWEWLELEWQLGAALAQVPLGQAWGRVLEVGEKVLLRPRQSRQRIH